jgi:hexosaminidase
MKLTVNGLFCYGLASIFLLLAGHALAAEPRGAGLSLLPQPLLVQPLEAGFQPGPRLVIDVGEIEAMSESVAWLAELISEHSGLEVLVSASSDQGSDIRLLQVSEEALRERFTAGGLARSAKMAEAYSLTIDPSGIVIQAVGEPGLFYGMTTLWQVLSALNPEASAWPGLLLLDAPEFSWRGLMLDSARHMQSVEFIKQYLDWMSLHKLNMFHWHLTDDQAWRMEIKRYPRLAAIGGYRVPAGEAPGADIDPATGKPRLYGGYYTQDEMREVVSHARRRQITVVPEIDVPGHATAAITAYPELGVEGHGVTSVPASWGIFDNVFNLEEPTFDFLEGVLSEVVDIFPGPFIHLGGDEVETGQWAASERTVARMAELGIKDLQSVQNYYVERLQKFLDAHGKRVIGWDEVVESDLPPHSVVMSWRGVQGAIEAAAKGHETVLSPAPTLYLDHIQTTAADAPPGRGGVITVRDIYEFDPLPESLGENRDLVLGLQGNLWTEHVRTESRAAYMTWPRATAIAELGWSAATDRDWDDFAARLPDAVRRLKQVGVAAADDDHALFRRPLPIARQHELRREDRELELCSQAIVLALEDDAPLKGERESYLVDIQNPCWIWRNAPLTSLHAIRASVGQLPFNFEIGEAIHHVVVEPAEGPYGSLRVRLGNCDGPIIAEASLARAVENPAATVLPPAEINLAPDAGATADLCFTFSRNGVDPIWVIDWVELEQATQ